MNPVQASELLLQSLEHERGGVKSYKAAIACALRPDLKQEGMRYLAQTEQHVVAHPHHTQGWAREWWLESLGFAAELPSAEEKLEVTSAAEAQTAKESSHSRH